MGSHEMNPWERLAMQERVREQEKGDVALRLHRLESQLAELRGRTAGHIAGDVRSPPSGAQRGTPTNFMTLAQRAAFARPSAARMTAARARAELHAFDYETSRSLGMGMLGLEKAAEAFAKRASLEHALRQADAAESSEGESTSDQAEIDRMMRRALEEVAEVAMAADVPVALIGGLALQHWGLAQPTTDVDVVAADRLGALPGPRTPLPFGGDSIARTDFTIDVVVRSDGYKHLYNVALGLSAEVRGLPLRVVTPTYLAAMKLAAGRPKDFAHLAWLLGIIDPPGALEQTVCACLGPYAVEELRRFRYCLRNSNGDAA